jgi:hypothetical protein
MEEVSQFKKVVKVCCIKRIIPRRRHAARCVLVIKYFCTCKQVHVFCTRKQVVSQIGQSGGPLTLPLLLSVIRSQTTTFVLVSKYSNMLYQAYHTQKKQVQSFERTSLACSAQKNLKKVLVYCITYPPPTYSPHSPLLAAGCLAHCRHDWHASRTVRSMPTLLPMY